MKTLKLITLATTLTLGLAAHAQSEKASHGGGNGGDDLELDLRKRSLQIGHFLKSTTGSEIFNALNANAVFGTIEKSDIDVTSAKVVDKYGTERTCINEPDRSLITCNLDRINALKKNRQDDILTAILFHEILGLMNIELGHQDNVSMYPISSKIIAYHAVVASTPVSEASIRPEYFGKDNRAYGITLENKKTKETVRMICLNDHVEIHRCRNYSLVRKANEFQAPLVPEVVSLSPDRFKTLSYIISDGYYYKSYYKKSADLLSQIFNLKNNLALIGKTQSVSEAKYEKILAHLKESFSDLNKEIKKEEDVQKEKERRKNEMALLLQNFEKNFSGTSAEKLCQLHAIQTGYPLTTRIINVCSGLSEKSITCLETTFKKLPDFRFEYDNFTSHILDCKKIN